MQLFDKPADYQAFERVLEETLEVAPMRILAYCLMPNHWHLLLWPQRDGELAIFMQRLTITHVRRWQEHRGFAGLGHVYQGRYKSFPVQSDEHFLVVARYVERNALRADFVVRAEDWRWSSLWRRQQGTRDEQALLTAWPVERPRNWTAWVNQAETEQELAALRKSIQRGRPFGSPEWQKRNIEPVPLFRSAFSFDGNGSFEKQEKYVYDGDNIALQFDGASSLTNRYLHAPAIDQILADEHVSNVSTPGDILWPLTDNLGSVRDLIESDGDVVNHIVYGTFGQTVDERTRPSTRYSAMPAARRTKRATCNSTATATMTPPTAASSAKILSASPPATRT